MKEGSIHRQLLSSVIAVFLSAPYPQPLSPEERGGRNLFLVLVGGAANKASPAELDRLRT